jgi:hypothetical protein
VLRNTLTHHDVPLKAWAEEQAGNVQKSVEKAHA